jgi:tetratricopeptide (TPR) repeat protein
MRHITRLLACVFLAGGCATGDLAEPAAIEIVPAASPASSPQYDPRAETVVQPVSRSEAEVAFWRARVGRDDYDYISRIRLANALLTRARATGEHELPIEAEAIARRALEIAPSARDAWISMAFALSAQHRFREARAAAEKAVELNSNDEMAWCVLGDVALDLGDVETARDAYTRMSEDDEGLFSLARLANLAEVEGDTAEALRLLEAATARGTELGAQPVEIARCHVRIGTLHAARGRYDRAEAAYSAARDVWPDGYLVLEQLAALRFAEGRLDESEELYRRVVANAPHPDMIQGLARVVAAQGREDEAIRLRDRALAAFHADIESGDTGHYRHLALFLCDDLDAPEEALIWIRRDLELREDDGARITLAWIQMRAGRIDAALGTIGDDFDIRSLHDPELLYRVGEVLRAGGTNTWRDAFERAIALNPRHRALHSMKQHLRG